MPPGVTGSEPSSRTIDQAANASIKLTSLPETPVTRNETSITPKTVSWPASVVTVSRSQRRRSSSIALARKRTNESPVQVTGFRRITWRPQLAIRAARSPTRRVKPSFASPTANAATATTKIASPISATVSSSALRSFWSVSSASATIGKPSIANWFQIPVIVTASAIGARSNFHARSIA